MAEKENGAAPATPALARKAAAAWQWEPGGVRIGEGFFAFATPIPGKLQEYADRLLEVTEAFSMILWARQSFMLGQAKSYAGGFENARLLAAEYRIAQEVLGKTAREVGSFFGPAGLVELLEPSPQLFKKFVDEALDRLGAFEAESVGGGK